MENESDEDLILRSSEIMESAIDKASELLMSKPKIAEIILKQLLKCDPEHNTCLQLLGLCKHRMGENIEAIEIIQSVLDLDDTNADNWNNLGLSYGGIGNQKKAIECLKKAIDLNPSQFFFKNNLALQYRAINDYDNAIDYMKQSIESAEKPQLWLNLGGIYGEMGNLDESENCFRKALSLDPEYAAAYVDLSFSYHLKGDWKKGFAAYEWRFLYYPQMNFYKKAYDVDKLWNGKDDLNEKRVLIYGEQGVGDIIQFSRYCKNLKDLGAYVIVHCPASIDAVIRRIDGVDDTTNRDIINDKGEKFPEYDYQFSIMSFPYLLDLQEISGKAYINPATYLFKDYLKTEYKEGFNIGVVWAGNPSHPHDRKRSFPLKYLENISNLENVNLFSLQIDTRPRQYGSNYDSSKFQPDSDIVDFNQGSENVKLIDLTNMIQSFDDTCTILSGLDLLICCDTATAHLAGAMGVPVWVAVAFNPDWRWTNKGNKTHWYDSMSLFRQNKKDDWINVFEEMRIKLENLLQNK